LLIQKNIWTLNFNIHFTPSGKDDTDMDTNTNPDSYGIIQRHCFYRNFILKKRVTLERTGVAWVTKPFTNWKKTIDKMKAHSQSEIYIQSRCCCISGTYWPSTSKCIQSTKEDGYWGTAAMYPLSYIAHTTNFEDLISLVESCCSEYLKDFSEFSGNL